MTKRELEQLTEISLAPTAKLGSLLRNYLETVTVSEEVKAQRTGSQNNALHLWFSQIADECRDVGIDSKILFSKTMHVEVTPDIIKGMWKVLQNAYYKKKSTTELKKTGEIDKLQDHFIRFFGEQHGITLPPFPSNDIKAWEEIGGEKLSQHNKLKDNNYPEYNGAPTI